MSEVPQQRPTDRAIFARLDELQREVSRQLAEIKEQVTDIEKDSKETRQILTGDGVDHPGVVLRLKALEQAAEDEVENRKSMTNRLWAIAAAVGSLVLLDLWPHIKRLFAN